MLSRARPSAYIKGDTSALEDQSSPGFLFTRSNDIDATVNPVYLQNAQISTNLVGIIVPINSGEITAIFTVNEDANTFGVKIQRRTGPGTFVDLATQTLTAERKKFEVLVSPVSVALGDELVAQVSSGTCRNVKVGLIIGGNT